MIDKSILKLLMGHANENDIISEVGGLGFLTKLLAEKAKRVVTVKIDPCLIRIFKKTLHFNNVEIIKGDILKIKPPTFNKVVLTHLYPISPRILFWLLKKTF